MTNKIPRSIESYFQALNARDTDAMAACFGSEAVVYDEGQEFRGAAAIRQWIDTTTQKYRVTVDVTGINEQDGATIVTGLVSGNFDGSPISLHFHFTLEGDKIAALTIRG